MTAPAFSEQYATVGPRGLTGGTPDEGGDAARERLYASLRTPPRAGNWEHLAELAEKSSTLVKKAFVYPIVNGPSTYAIAVTSHGTATSKSREVPATVIDTVVAPFVRGSTAEYVEGVITTVEDVDFDLSLALSLPASRLASPAGPGGGWTDATPWPRNIAGDPNFICRVTLVYSETEFEVDAPSPPIKGVSRIAWLSPLDWKVRHATVTDIHGSSSQGAYRITLDAPFEGVEVDEVISANAENIDAYFAAILEHFATLGPGEKFLSSNPAFYRAFRHPTPAQAAPYKVGARLLRAVTDVGDEVEDASFLYRSFVGAPAVPGSVQDPPRIFTPKRIGIYEASSFLAVA